MNHRSACYARKSDGDWKQAECMHKQSEFTKAQKTGINEKALLLNLFLTMVQSVAIHL